MGQQHLHEPGHSPKHASLGSSSRGSARGASPVGSDRASLASTPQESGRNPDGTPIWAPASSQPSRTFTRSDSDDTRMSDLPTPSSVPLQVIKELGPEDFVKSPEGSEHAFSPEPRVTGGGIDISLLAPGLDGIEIKTRAISQTFIENVMSPSPRLSPLVPPSRPAPIYTGGSPVAAHGGTLHPAALPATDEDHRRLRDAGHTPRASVSFIYKESANATPTQSKRPAHDPSMDSDEAQVVGDLDGQTDGLVDEDPELKGPLSLPEDDRKFNGFLLNLTSKLEDAARNEELPSVVTNLPPADSVETTGQSSPTISSMLSPSCGSADNHRAESQGTEEDDETEETIVPLKIKASMNFGKPLGRV